MKNRSYLAKSALVAAMWAPAVVVPKLPLSDHLSEVLIIWVVVLHQGVLWSLWAILSLFARVRQAEAGTPFQVTAPAPRTQDPDVADLEHQEHQRLSETGR